MHATTILFALPTHLGNALDEKRASIKPTFIFF